MSYLLQLMIAIGFTDKFCLVCIMNLDHNISKYRFTPTYAHRIKISLLFSSVFFAIFKQIFYL